MSTSEAIRTSPDEGRVDLIDVLDHVVTEFDVSRIARTDEIDGAPSYLVGGTFDAWSRALHAVIADSILVSAEDQPVWIHVVATRRDITLWIRDDGWGLSTSDLDALIEGPAFAFVRAGLGRQLSGLKAMRNFTSTSAAVCVRAPARSRGWSPS